MSVSLVQCLCGPLRHCIAALAYDESKTDQAAEGELRLWVGMMTLQREINPWCGLCGSMNKHWIFEVGRTKFATIDEAMPYLLKAQREQARAAEALKALGAAYDRLPTSNN